MNALRNSASDNGECKKTARFQSVCLSLISDSEHYGSRPGLCNDIFFPFPYTASQNVIVMLSCRIYQRFRLLGAGFYF